MIEDSNNTVLLGRNDETHIHRIFNVTIRTRSLNRKIVDNTQLFAYDNLK